MKRVVCALAILLSAVSSADERPLLPHAPLSVTIDSYVIIEASVHGVNPDFMLRIMAQESRGNPMAVHKNKNSTTDLGLFQLNSRYLPKSVKDPFNYKQNTDAAVELVATYLGTYGGDYHKTYCAYAMGASRCR